MHDGARNRTQLPESLYRFCRVQSNTSRSSGEVPAMTFKVKVQEVDGEEELVPWSPTLRHDATATETSRGVSVPQTAKPWNGRLKYDNGARLKLFMR